MSVVALFIWGDTGFAELDYRDTLRLVIPASTMLILGVQTVLASFFISILGIEHSDAADPALRADRSLSPPGGRSRVSCPGGAPVQQAFGGDSRPTAGSGAGARPRMRFLEPEPAWADPWAASTGRGRGDLVNAARRLPRLGPVPG